jgi:hypothetical protein
MSNYTNIFGGNTILPSDVSYVSYNLSTTDIVLSWPLDTNTDSNVAATIIDVNCTAASRKIYLPPANLASTGQAILFNNVGTTLFSVVTSTGVAVISPASGTLWQAYLTNNSTASGVWRAYQFGAAASSSNAAALAGLGLLAISSTLNQSMPVLELYSDYTLGEPERATTILWLGGLGVVTLPNAFSLLSGWFCNVNNAGTGVVTFTVSGGTIDGNVSKDIAPGESCVIGFQNDGFARYYTIGFGQNVDFAFDYTSIALPTDGSATYTLTIPEQNRIAYKFTGNITADITVLVPPTVQQYWVDNETDASFSLSLQSTVYGASYAVPYQSRAILYCDGTDVVNAATAGISTPISIANGGTGAITASQARINLGGGTTGIAVFQSVSQANALTALGGTPYGQALFTTQVSIAGIGAITPGSGYVSAAYTNVPLTGGSGSGATANITVTGGAVTSVSIVNQGLGYAVGDNLSASNLNLGGSGAGFSIPVTATTAILARALLDVYSTTETNNVAIAYAIGLG